MIESRVYPAVALLFAFVVSAMIGAVLTFAVRNIARGRGWVPLPARHHIHKQGTPRLGGIAVFLAFLLVFGIVVVSGGNPSWRDELNIIAAASMLFLVGVVDDFSGLSARVKLGFQIAAGAMFYAGGTYLFSPEVIPGTFMTFRVGAIASFIATIAWVVLITNALNIVDGLDGLAAGVALFTSITLFGLALAERDNSVMFCTLLIGGAVLGFLRYNFNPATIFLGDGGSLFLGAMLSGLALQPGRAAAPTMIAVAIPLVSFGLPIVETFVSIIRRFVSGTKIFGPDQEHIHHKLLQLGFTHRETVIALYGVCALFALLSLFLIHPGRVLVGLILIIVGTITCVGVQRLGYPEFNEISRAARRTLEQKTVIANDVSIRKASSLLRGARSRADIVTALDGLLRTGEFDSYNVTSSGVVIQRYLQGSVIADADAGSSDTLPGWSVTIDLSRTEADSIGRFTLRRAFRRCSVLLDVSLLFSEIGPPLADACFRLEQFTPLHSDASISQPDLVPAGSVRPVPGAGENQELPPGFFEPSSAVQRRAG